MKATEINNLMFDVRNVIELQSLVHPNDKNDFFFDVRSLYYFKQSVGSIYGYQRFLFKQDMPTLDAGFQAILKKNNIGLLEDL